MSPPGRERGRTAALTIGSGLALAGSLPPWGWWPLAALGLVGLDRLVAELPARSRALRGGAVALVTYLPSLWWIRDLTLPGWPIACVVYAAMLALGIAASPPGRGRWLALPGAWTLAEAVRWSWPFGGVPLANLALGQVAGPLAPVAAVGGSLGLVLVTVAVGSAAAAMVARTWTWAAGLAAGVAVVLLVAGLAPGGHEIDRIRVALVQGGGPQGTRAADTDERVVFERHLDASASVAIPVDLVVWPEDVVDVEGPVTGTREGAELAALARRLGAPLVVGVVEGDGDRFHNAAVVFGPDGTAGDRYDKVHLVPFGEYVPLRWMLDPVAGGALPDRDAYVGQGPARLDTGIGRLSVVISWEVFFGDRAREGVADGGRLVINPTNGSSYTGTIVQTQQVAASRLRAVETGRWVLQVAPTGLSAVVDPTGEVVERTGVSERAVLSAQVGLRSGLTWYTRWGNGPALAAAAVLLSAGWLVQRRARPRGSR